MLSPYLVEQRHIAVKRCRHGLFMFSRNDLFVGRALDAYGEWCDFEIQLMRAFLQPGDVVVDAGANIGSHTIPFANAVGRDGMVHAFEPVRRHFHVLSGNVALNALDNVVCHRMAVGGVDGEIKIPKLPDPEVTYNYSAVFLSDQREQGEPVPITTLDSMNLPACRMIKIDTEGMELQVFDGAKKLIQQHRPLIYVENNEPGVSARLTPALESIGYQAWWSIAPYFNRHNFYNNQEDLWPGVMPAANLLCAPKELNIQVDLDPFQGAADDWRASLKRAGFKFAFQPTYGPTA
jgi:FkbM family methyltransferase